MRDAPLRAEDLEKALANALRDPRAQARPLYAELVKRSRLPGTRPNLELAEAFAASCAGHGKKADALIREMTTLEADRAPGGTELEFLPMCGVYAAGFRAANDRAAEPKLLPLLHDAAEDLRFRVRDAVVAALAKIGAVRGDALVHECASWMDGFFHGAAVLRALVTPAWLDAANDGEAASELLATALRTLADAPRAASRYPGFKALTDAVGAAPLPLALRFGAPVFAVLENFASCKDPHLRELVLGSIDPKRGGGKLDARFPADVARVRAAFGATAKPVRDPRSLPGPTRKRGGGRRR